MHLTILVVGQRILLDAFRHQLVGDDDRILLFGLNNKFQYVEQLACVAPTETQQVGGLSQLNLAFLQFNVFGNGVIEQL